MTIEVLLVSPNLKVREEALNRFVERHAMLGEFVPLEIVLEIRWTKPMPVDHGSFYRAVACFGFVVGPTIRTHPPALTPPPAPVGCSAMLGGQMLTPSHGTALPNPRWVEPRGNDAIQAEFDEPAKEPLRSHNGRNGKEHVLIEIDEEARKKREEQTVGKTLAQRTVPRKTTIAPYEDHNDAGREQQGEPGLFGEIGAA
jgi:hypothetical protein